MTGDNPAALAVADVNGDGHLDIVAANSVSNTVSVLLGSGIGTFAAQQTYATGQSPSAVAVADLDGDGYPDIVVGNKTSGTISVLHGIGGGSFAPQVTEPGLSGISALTLADINHDNHPDLIAIATDNLNSTEVDIQQGNGDGTFQDEQDFSFSSGYTNIYQSITAVDLNNDNNPDIVATLGDGIVVLTNAYSPPNTDPTGAPAIVGMPTQGGILTAYPGTLADADGLGAIGYQWQRDDGQGGWTAIGGAVLPSYALTQDDVGHAVRAVASYVDGEGTAEEMASAATAPVANVNDDPTGAPSIIGAALQGGMLTAGVGTLADVDGLGSINYQWQRYSSAGWSSIASGDTYGLGQADVGHPLRVIASYTDLGGHNEQVTSAATMPVVAAALPVTLPPGINLVLNGGFEVAQQFSGWGVTGNTDSNEVTDEEPHSGAQSAHLGSPTQASLDQAIATTTANRYQVSFWLRNAGGTDNAFAASFDGQDVALTATGLEAGGWKLYDAIVTATASVSDLRFTFHNVPSHFFLDDVSVVDVTAPLGEVMVAGTAIQGATLGAGNDLADVDGMGPVDYRWERDNGQGGWIAIAGTASASYTLTQADVGHMIRAVASYVDGGGTSESVASAATTAVANVNDDPTGTVTIAGNAQQGETLSAGNTLDDADGVGDIAYRWQRQTGATWTDIADATAASYTLTQDDVGHAVRAVASYVDGEGTAEEVTSAATATVANVNDAPTGAPAVTGVAAKDETLTVGSGTLADLDGLGTLAWQWQRQTGAAWNDIASATAASYTALAGDVGHSLRAVATYEDGGGTLEHAASVATAPVGLVNHLPTGAPAVAGSPALGNVLTASAGTLADANGIGAIAWRWQARAGGVWSDIAGATGAAYTVRSGDVGEALRAVAAYTDGDGFQESVASSPTRTVAASGNFARTDTTTGTASSPVGEAYAGPTNYLQWQYIASGDADVILGANVANVFLRGGGGNDALAVSAGSNVLDGGAGSTFMVGATGADGGADTFFVARPAEGTPVWDTILHFHPGDRVTFWDYGVGRDSYAWAPGAQGAAGFEGATLHVSYAGTGGATDAGLTFAGLSVAEASFRLAISTGTAGGHGYLAVTCTA